MCGAGTRPRSSKGSIACASANTPARESGTLAIPPIQESRCPSFDVDALRAEFPALAREQDGRPVVFLDGPGGTQVPQRVIDAVSGYYRDDNANSGGVFTTSVRTDAMTAEAHAAVADFLGRGLARRDQVRLQHVDADAPPRPLHRCDDAARRRDRRDHARPRGQRLDLEGDGGRSRRDIQTVDIDLDDVTLDLEDLESKLGPRTKLVAVGYASNAVGTVNPVAEIVARAHEVGALTYVDAVAFAPHGPIDVRALDTDFLVCSAYKWFGPHLGALYGKADVLDRLPAYKVRP